MAMNLGLNSILRRGLSAVLCLGLLGLGGCKQHFHPQFAHAIGGGNVGKGQDGVRGKKRGFEARAASANEIGGKSTALGGDPLAGLFGSKKDSSSSKNKPNVFSGAQARSPRPPKTENPFGTTSKADRLDGKNPFAEH